MDDPQGRAAGPQPLVRVVQPAAAAATMVSAGPSGSGAAALPAWRALARSSSRRLAPWTYSMAKNGASPSVPTS